MSSLRVQAKGAVDCVPGAGQVAVYEHSDYLYPCAIRSRGDYATAAAFGVADNSLSSVRVGSGAQACVCTLSDFRDVCEAFSSDDPNFGNNRIGHDTASSLRVQPAGASCVPVPPVGVKTLSLHNCNVNHHAVYFWTLDHTTGVYEQKGTQAAQYDSFGSCPSGGAPAVTFDLPDGHNVSLIVVDPQMITCTSGNTPNSGQCQTFVQGPIAGDAHGTVLGINVP